MPAFWIDKLGKITDTKDNHITEIVTNPKKFGFTKEEVVSTFEKYGEKMPSEGKARRELIDTAIGRGFIRLRQYRNSHWSITIAKMDKRTRSLITDWAKKIIGKGIHGIVERDPYIPVKFVAVKSRHENEEYTLKDISGGILLDGRKIVETIYDGVVSFKQFINER